MKPRKKWQRTRGREGDGMAVGDCTDTCAAGRPARSRRANRKVLQLCSQVADTLSLVLSGECADDVLRSLQVVAVTPAPDASQLLVIVAPALADEILEPADVLSRLASCTGRLRYEVAATISRRRTPQLAFQFVSRPPVI